MRPLTPEPDLVLIHGGRHDSRCWQPTIDMITRLAPARRVLAVNLPGRQGVPGDLRTLTIGDCTAALRQQIDKAGLQDVVLVGHSLAGIVLPALTVELGPDRVREVVALACCVPPDGQRVIDVVSPPVRVVGRLTMLPLPRWLAARLFCNDMNGDQRSFSLDILVPESPRLVYEHVRVKDIPPDVPRRWILTRRDRALAPKRQRQFAANLGVHEIVEIDAGHNAMISRPRAVAEVLLDHTSAATL